MQSRPSFLLVDGNNIIHAWPELARLHATNRGAAHAELIRELTAYQDFSGRRVVVVFDGRGLKNNEERLPDGMQVFYSSASYTADDLIERLALKYAGVYEITVATNDRAEQDMVVGAGGIAISADGLRDLIGSVDREMDDWLRRHRKR